MTSSTNGWSSAVSDQHPPATRKDHESFCRTEARELVRDAQGRPTSHYMTYKLSLHDGRFDIALAPADI